jgi:hypothetical protein
MSVSSRFDPSQAMFSKTWTKWWFVLTDVVLAWYDTEADVVAQRPRGELAMSGVKLCKSGQNKTIKLMLRTGSEVVLRPCDDDTGDMDGVKSWIREFNRGKSGSPLTSPTSQPRDSDDSSPHHKVSALGLCPVYVGPFAQVLFSDQSTRPDCGGSSRRCPRAV